MTRRSSPGRRRLRFSFQINDVKDPNRLCRPHRLAPGVGGGGYLVASVFRVNRLFRAFFSPPEEPGFEERSAMAEARSERKNHCGLPRGFPHRSVAIRLKDRKLYAGDGKIKGFFNRWFSVACRSRLESGVFMGHRSPCQSTSDFSFVRRPKTLKQKNCVRRRRGVAVIGMSLTGRCLASSPGRARPNRLAPQQKRRSSRAAL